jgi:hypothetical protein
MIKTICALIFFISFLFGCTSIAPTDLTKSTSNMSLTLHEDLTYSGRRGMFSFVDGLKKGLYKAELEDEKGIYLRGPSYCTFTTPGSDNITRTYEGGIWWPKNGSLSEVRIYSYFSSEAFYNTTAGVRRGALAIDLDDGRIHLWPVIDDPHFAKNLVSN